MLLKPDAGLLDTLARRLPSSLPLLPDFEKAMLTLIRRIDIRIESCDTLLIIQGGSQRNAILRKEEVMSNMDSSIKPSAVASLLK
jgi:hypothetical protein